MSHSQQPLVSIITPSYNQGRFIRETINSILTQDYANLEHIVVDGGSTDDTLSILQEYAQKDPRFRFISEPDRGQSHALNKGLALARGEIIGWLNSDDTYVPGAILKAVHAFASNPAWGMLHGNCYVINEYGQVSTSYPSEQADSKKLYQSCVICQPSAFIRAHVFRHMGGVDEKLQFCMDYDLWMRIAKFYPIGYLPQYLGNARIHTACKSATKWHSVGVPEVLRSLAKNYSSIPSHWISYVPQYKGMGVLDLLRIYKSFPSNTARITSMNRGMDLWAPPVLRAIVESDPSAPAQMLLVKGKVPGSPVKLPKPFVLTALVNGINVKSFTVDKPTFALEIPLDPNATTLRVDIASSSVGLPSTPQVQQRIAGGYMAEEIIPLSYDEVIVYKAFSRS
ncbi:glycosyltransferase family 2 protein [Brevibacillus fortis]|uniref:Glycosyltransferase n=1 Tax=Brevibacillus fortis TaxID=2126352 RepID=A0A2P7VCK3_9BACL|nr:glycosyltransferase family 2 protein [Brevibacillus fortis]MED1782920.1 glycosyltransferase family 2 protein [Brevibacillus fortis]PSJ96912.1 glycosyltransferase [Brevibacillus fortis]